MMIIRFLVVALLVFIAVTIAAFVYLQWWQALIVVIAMIFAFVLGMKLIIRSFVSNLGKAMMMGFEIKAKVLRGATAEVHSVEAAPEPPPPVIDQAGEEDQDEGDDDDDDDDDDEEDEEDEEESKRDLNYYRIDFTIRPTHSDGPMQHWDVGDLCVVDVKAPPLTLKPDDDTDAGEGFHFQDVQILEDGQLRDDEQGKYEGPQRLSALVGVPPGLRELKFRYYTEQFGRIVLPPPYPREPGAGQPVLA
jgi:hypothetical protein